MDLEMYKENILDHYKNPKNKRTIKNPTIEHRDVNPLCGDEVTLFLKIDEINEVVIDVSFEGDGCVISQASASLLTEYLLGKNVNELEKMQSSELIELLGIPISHTRMKCALLSFKILKDGLTQMNSNKSDQIKESSLDEKKNNQNGNK